MNYLLFLKKKITALREDTAISAHGMEALSTLWVAWKISIPLYKY